VFLFRSGEETAAWRGTGGAGPAPSEAQHQPPQSCSGSEAGSYVRLIDFVYHSTLGFRVMKKKRSIVMQRMMQGLAAASDWRQRRAEKEIHRERARERDKEGRVRGGLVFKAHRWLYHSTLGSRVIKKKKKGADRNRVGDGVRRARARGAGPASSSDIYIYIYRHTESERVREKKRARASEKEREREIEREK